MEVDKTSYLIGTKIDPKNGVPVQNRQFINVNGRLTKNTSEAISYDNLETAEKAHSQMKDKDKYIIILFQTYK